MVTYRMKRPLPNGTTHLLFTGLELLRRVASLVPPSRVYLDWKERSKHRVFQFDNKAVEWVNHQEDISRALIGRSALAPKAIRASSQPLLEAAGIEAAKGGSAPTRDQRPRIVFPLKTGRPSVRVSPGSSVRFGPFLVPLGPSPGDKWRALRPSFWLLASMP
jgi:hypothetical protein